MGKIPSNGFGLIETFFWSNKMNRTNKNSFGPQYELPTAN